MRVHVDVLGWLFVLAGATAASGGIALFCLAVGTAAAVSRTDVGTSGWTHPLAMLFLAVGAGLFAGGTIMAAIGRALGRRQPKARPLALGLAVLNLALLPFGTALGIYTFWVLVNDEARREFGRAERADSPRHTML